MYTNGARENRQTKIWFRKKTTGDSSAGDKYADNIHGTEPERNTLAAVVWRRAAERKGAVRINKLFAWQLSEEDFPGITNPKLSFNKDRSDVLDHTPENAMSVFHVIENTDEDK